MIGLRQWNHSNDTVAIQQLASRLWPLATHPGGLGWEAASDQLPAETMLAERDGRIVGWAGVTGGELVVQGAPIDAEAAAALLRWAIAQASVADVRLPVFDGDDGLRALVLGAGFHALADGESMTGMFRPATSEGPRLPDGYRIRAMRDGEETERVEVHRAAWRPLTLPWPEGHGHVIDPAATSRFTAAHFAALRHVWLYDQRLDLVVEGPDGGLVGCCTAWWDPASSCAEIEPLGIVPEHRRKGLATALCLEICARVAQRGGDQVFINTWHMDHYPAPAATYLAAGFVVKRRAVFYRQHVRP